MQDDNVEPEDLAPKRPGRRALDADQVPAIMQGLDEGFGSDPAAVSGVALVLGSGAKVRIHDGRLHVEDGEGWYRRTREWGRVSDLRRLIISARSGYLSLAVFDHCRKAGIEVVIVNGVVTIDHGRHTGARSGRVLRRGR